MAAAPKKKKRRVRPPPEMTREETVSTPLTERIEMVDVDSLNPDEGNPRVITDGEFKTLCKVLKEFGFQQPLIVRKSDKLVIGGHQRLKAAKKLRMKKVPVVFGEWSDAEVRQLNIALNKTGGDFDYTRLGEYIQPIVDDGLDPTLTGFDQAALETILDVHVVTNEELDEIFEGGEETFTGFKEDLDTIEDEEKRPSEKDETEPLVIGQIKGRLTGSIYYRFSHAWQSLKKKAKYGDPDELMELLLDKAGF